MQTRLGQIPEHLISGRQPDSLRDTCSASVENSRLLLAQLQDYLRGKPDGAEISAEYLLR